MTRGRTARGLMSLVLAAVLGGTSRLFASLE
jgi:hypothetical protein